MRDYAFGVACTAIYDFFLYELCDYYLELLKPLMAVPTPGSAAAAASPATPEALAAATAAASDAGGDIAVAQRLGRATLHLCLERGFQLLHPMMPFVTEELWQRLPGRGLPQRAAPGAAADPTSIMISAYPTSDARLEAGGVEGNFAVFQALVKGGRSLRADADIPPSRAAVFYVAVGDAATAALAQAQKQDLVTLLKASELTFVPTPSAVPEGCSAYVVSDAASIHLQLKGLVDPVAEVAKLEKKSAKVTSELEGIRKRQGVATYKDKVPKEVQESDAASVIALEKQGAVILSLITQYKSW
jgi:valyl-tRNA synthetase